MKFSMTISGIIILVISQILGDTVSDEALANFVEVGGLLIGAVVSYVGRLRQGDINIFGVKQ